MRSSRGPSPTVLGRPITDWPRPSATLTASIGINRHLTPPDVGEDFLIEEGGAPHPNQTTWAFHMAAVVMSSGADLVTLENFTMSQTSIENSDWNFQMYGPIGQPSMSSTRAICSTAPRRPRSRSRNADILRCSWVYNRADVCAGSSIMRWHSDGCVGHGMVLSQPIELIGGEGRG